jgi:hypothetical protein
VEEKAEKRNECIRKQEFFAKLGVESVIPIVSKLSLDETYAFQGCLVFQYWLTSITGSIGEYFIFSFSFGL